MRICLQGYTQKAIYCMRDVGYNGPIKKGGPYMKKIIVQILFFAFIPIMAIAEKEFVAGAEISIPFSFGERTGIYTGEMEGDSPSGFGCFRSTNDSGVIWIYMGEFSDNNFNGRGETIWSSGKYETGIYKDSALTSGTIISSDGTAYVDESDNSMRAMYSSDDVISAFMLIPGCKNDSQSLQVDGYTIYQLVIGNGEDAPNVHIFTDSYGKVAAVTLKANDFSKGTIDDNLYEAINTLSSLFGFTSLGDNEEQLDIGNGYTIMYKELEATEYKALFWGMYLSVYQTDSGFDPNEFENVKFEQPIRLDMYDEMKRTIESYSFDSLLSYLEENKPTLLDLMGEENYNNMESMASRAASLAEQCVITYDEFDGVATAVYRGVEEISENVSIVSTAKDTSFSLTVGFVADDWVFFEDVSIIGDGIEKIDAHFNYFDVSREVLNNGKVCESISYSPYNMDLERLAVAQNAKIRFEGEEKSLIRNVSEPEIEAISVLSELPDLVREMLNTIHRSLE